MKIIRYDPRLPLGNDIETYFDTALRGLFHNTGYNGVRNDRKRRPTVNFSEDETNFYARFELPGVKKKEIGVELENDVLTVKADRSETDKKDSNTFTFTESVNLPEGVDFENVAAKHEDGLLTITLPKSEKRKALSIAVK